MTDLVKDLWPLILAFQMEKDLGNSIIFLLPRDAGREAPFVVFLLDVTVYGVCLLSLPPPARSPVGRAKRSTAGDLSAPHLEPPPILELFDI